MLGAQRSGTTIIATAIGAHPAVALLNEERHGAMFRVVGGKIPAVKLCTPSQVQIDRRWNSIYHLLFSVDWILHRVGYRVPRSRLSLRDMTRRTELMAVCLIREPSASLDALRRREKWPERAFRDTLRRCYDTFVRLESEPRVKCCVVSYDRFIREPESQLRKLCDWLGLPFDGAMLDAPKLNPYYPESSFRADKVSAVPEFGHREEDAELAALRRSYEALLARAL
ncbi:MAG TPA: sulfotransferase [Stellaceae bacterium]